MQKIYVLLRNDKQTGPYSLDELIQFDLKPYDLIWIEGKSAGWYYPQEIAALHPYLNFLPQQPKPQSTTEAKTVFVSRPPTPATKEVTAVPPPVEEPLYVPREAPRANDRSSKSLEEEVYARFVTPPEEKPLAAAPKEPAANKPSRSGVVAIATVLIVGGVFAASWMMNRQNNAEEIISAAPAEAVQHELTPPAVATNDKYQRSTHLSARIAGPRKVGVTRKQPTGVHPPSSQRTAERKEVSAPAADTEASEPATAAGNEEPVISAEETTTAPAETTAPQEKKKKLRDKILDLFKKKPEEEKTEEAKPSETVNGERRATRRESGAMLAQMVSIRLDVPNDWMMGIRGAKAMLVNRSGERISKATVEVLYYNDDNELLQKKVITFSKVDGKESQTVPIPDHPSATRVDHNLVSVTGQPSA